MFQVWKGGLGVWGGILFGCIAGWIVMRRSGKSAAVFADAVAPGLLLAQAIGRLGNWFSQELYGKPTDASWALEIDPEHRVAEYEQYETFHPVFLYELIYNLSMVGVLLLVDWRFGSGHRRSSRSTSPSTPSGASSRSSCGSIRLMSWRACD